jgi:glycosyltransferase involved in cell wall biosynthesis
MKKVLFLTARTINPVVDGRRTTLKQMVQQVKAARADVYLCCMATDEEFAVPQPQEISETIRLFPVKTATKIWNVMTKTLFGHWMIQNAVYYSHKNQRLFNAFLQKIQPDIIVCDADRMSEYLLKSCPTSAHKYLDMDDRVTVTLSGQLDHMGKDANIYGNFQKQMPGFLLKLFRLLHLDKFIVKTELRLAAQFEKKAPKRFEKVFLVSPIEVSSYLKESQTSNIYCLPVAVDFSSFSAPVQHQTSPDTICFLGNMKIAHNQITLSHLIEDVLIPLRAKFPLRLLVVGQADSKAIEKFSAYSDFVSFTGTVPDVRPYCEECFCMAAPITYGSGIKIKVLENMAMGIPVITNDVGRSGIEAIPDQDFLIANSPTEMVTAIEKLYTDPAFQKTISQNGSNFIKNHHSFEATSPIVTAAILD